MHFFSPRRVLALFALLFLLFACSSDSDANNASEADAAQADGAAETGDATEQPVPTEPDPAFVEQLVFSLTGAPVAAGETDCLLDRADGDSTLTTALSGQQRFTPETYTALTVGVHGCMQAETLAASLLAISGVEDETEQATFSDCVLAEITDETDGDLSYVGLSALRVRFAPIPEGAHDATIQATRDCVPVSGVVEQLAVSTEQTSGFLIEVDRDCLADIVDEDFAGRFWEAQVTGEGADDLVDEMSECNEEYDSGLPREIPAGWQPWSGDRALAGVDPFTRNQAYDAAPPLTIDPDKDYQAVLTTADGEIRIRLFTEIAPLTVNNFVSLANDGYYDGTIFHRVLDNFMAQAGDPTGTGTGGPGYSFDDEESGLIPIDRRGLLAMANSGPDTNGSQFFITFAAATHLNGSHTVFGQVVGGDDVLAEVDLRDPQAPTSRGEQLVSVEIVELS